MEVVKPVFRKYKDSVSVEKLYRRRANRTQYKGEIESADELEFSPNSVASYLGFFGEIANSGDAEVEAWLIDFYDRYFNYCLELHWPGTEVGLLMGGVYNDPINLRDFRYIGGIFLRLIK